MAEEAFALSPISARPSVPGEADYDAIREAFMETARGRWFLNEYAKRNRHTDTGMVLEAVTRLEASLKAQKTAPAISLLETLGAIRSAVRQAKASAIEAMPRLESDEAHTAARNGARIIREIAWTLRECGADIRICDLLDTQVKAIDAGLQATPGEGRENVLASYDLLMQRIEQVVDGVAAAPAAARPAPAVAEPAAPESQEASVTPLFKAVAEAAVPQAAIGLIEPQALADAGVAAPATSVESAITERAVATPDDLPAMQVGAAAEAEHSLAAHDAETIEDLAVLDMVAMEMAVPDISEPVIEPEMAAPELAAPEPVQLTAVPPVTFDMVSDVARSAARLQPATTDAMEPEPKPSASLGAALIANGVIANPNAPASDPLAPIRRMSQAEKIAFFS